jgi:hypothetical protein
MRTYMETCHFRNKNDTKEIIIVEARKETWKVMKVIDLQGQFYKYSATIPKQIRKKYTK